MSHTLHSGTTTSERKRERYRLVNGRRLDFYDARKSFDTSMDYADESLAVMTALAGDDSERIESTRGRIAALRELADRWEAQLDQGQPAPPQHRVRLNLRPCQAA